MNRVVETLLLLLQSALNELWLREKFMNETKFKITLLSSPPRVSQSRSATKLSLRVCVGERAS